MEVSRGRGMLMVLPSNITRQRKDAICTILICQSCLRDDFDLPGAPATAEVSRGRRMLMVLPSNIKSQRKDGICTILICQTCLRHDFGVPGAPATLKVSTGRWMLMVLPSNITSQREDGIEAGRMLKEILASPADADKRHALCLWPAVSM